MNNFQWIWTYAKAYKAKGIIACLLILLSSALIIVNPMITGLLVDQVIAKGKSELLVPYLSIMIATTILRTIIRYSYELIFEKIGQDVLFGIRQDLYQKLQELDFDYFNHNRVGDIMARMTGDTDAIRHFVAWVTYQVAECILYFIAAIIMMSTINVPLMLALLAYWVLDPKNVAGSPPGFL